VRVLLSALILILAACGGSSQEWTLPAEMEGGWKLGVKAPSPETIELVKQLSAKKSLMAAYEGPGTVIVTAFQLDEGVAFEQVQRWRQQPGKIVFHHGPWFVILESTTLDARQLSGIAALLEKTMP
jgi:hypothetical protein